jgi:eukaryotic-like serine/threonine-protein kinase
MSGIRPTRMIGGRYVVLNVLVRDGSVVVWRAEDRVTGELVAVTQLRLPEGQGRDERRQVRERLLRAARAAGRLAHPAIVPVHDVVTDDDVDHLVTELVDAPALADRVAADGPLDPSAASEIAWQLAGALHEVHTAGVVHGDVTPQWVRQGPDGGVRLPGLGVAEALDPARRDRDPAFVAPELRAGGPATAESDLWQLGVTLHVALHGRPPAGSEIDPSGPLGEVLGGLLRDAPRERPSARQVVATLGRVGGARPAAAGPAPQRFWPAVAAAVLGLLAGLVIGLVVAGTGGSAVPVLSYGPGGDVVLPGALAGACLAAAPEAGATLAIADCAQPHGAEVVASLDPYGGREAPTPGSDGLAGFAAAACAAAFDAAVAPPDRNGVEPAALVPAPAAGLRDVHCLLRATDGDDLISGSRVGR